MGDTPQDSAKYRCGPRILVPSRDRVPPRLRSLGTAREERRQLEPGPALGQHNRLASSVLEPPLLRPRCTARQQKTQARSEAGGSERSGRRPPKPDFVGPRLFRIPGPGPREPAFLSSPFLLLKQAFKKLAFKSTGHKRGAGGGPESLSELEANIIFTTFQLATEWISTFLSFASESSGRNLVAISPLGTRSLNRLLLPPSSPYLTSEKSFNNKKIISSEEPGVNATDVIGWGWGGGSGKDSWKPHCTNKKQKGLSCFQCVNIWDGGGGGGSDPREAEFSKFKERELDSAISCSFLHASFKEDGSAVLPRGAPCALCKVPAPGRGCRAPGAEVCAKLRQLAGRHFNCGSQRHRDPSRPGWGVGGIAPSVSVSPFPASPQVSSPPSRRPQWTAPRLVPAGAAGVIPPGRGRLLARRLAAHRRAPGASGQYWFVSVRSGGHLATSGPRNSRLPTPQVSGLQAASGESKTRPALGRCAFGSGFGNQESPTRCCGTSESRFPTPSRGAVLARWEGWRRAFL
ncbi:uncharacterized protein LOC118501448 [Phyllostomus discolor]|uniref:Uncharacterized protein LOC118501448 n=1 Tax=Phyllostomus discolor TaxID=89673 RepID=A0A7E6E4C8_9CHIR|nr:uncharacterized protein LOC118501448 [Phyllostomus discolor]